MVRQIKYIVVNPNTDKIMHFSYNKKNAENWIRENRAVILKYEAKPCGDG